MKEIGIEYVKIPILGTRKKVWIEVAYNKKGIPKRKKDKGLFEQRKTQKQVPVKVDKNKQNAFVL